MTDFTKFTIKQLCEYSIQRGIILGALTNKKSIIDVIVKSGKTELIDKDSQEFLFHLTSKDLSSLKQSILLLGERTGKFKTKAQCIEFLFSQYASPTPIVPVAPIPHHSTTNVFFEPVSFNYKWAEFPFEQTENIKLMFTDSRYSYLKPYHMMTYQSFDEMKYTLTRILGIPHIPHIHHKYILYDLFWYITIRNDKIKITDHKEKEYICNLLSIETPFVKDNGRTYINDIAAIIHNMITGSKMKTKHDISTLDLNLEIINMDIKFIANLCYNVHDIVDFKTRKVSILSPVLYLIFLNNKDKDKAVFYNDKLNLELYMIEKGIVTSNYDYDYGTIGDTLRYISRELFKNGIVDSRNEFTLKELVDKYEPMGIWSGRFQLYKKIDDEARNTKKIWSFYRIKNPRNTNTMNLTTLLPHENDNLGDVEDPVISYGVQCNYDRYQLSELEETFRLYSDDKMFHFRVPDWMPGIKIDRCRDFPLSSIKELLDCLKITENPSNVVKTLINKINQGLVLMNKAQEKLFGVKTKYELLDDGGKECCKLILFWLFLYGMWLRFWKGPGNPWPFIGVDDKDQHIKCSETEREAHLLIQNEILKMLIISDEVKGFFEMLDIFDYDYQTGDVSVSNSYPSKLFQILEMMNSGNFCLSHGSDIILKSSYYILKGIFLFRDDAEFTDLLNTNILAINNYELMITETFLYNNNNSDDEFIGKYLEEFEIRLASIMSDCVKIDQFKIKSMSRTGHTDPSTFLNYEK